MRPLCSICVRRDADTLDEIDGKRRPVCFVCLEPVPDPPEELTTVFDGDRGGPKIRTLAIIRARPGLTFVEIRERLGMAGGGCRKAQYVKDHDALKAANTYSAAVMRLVKAGLVTRVGKWPEYTYYPVATAEKAQAA